MSEGPRQPGRPRERRLDDALLDSGLEVILERGYHSATLTEIGRRAGVGTPAIYRRWPTKRALALEIIASVAEPEPIPDTGSIREDLVAYMVLRLRTWSTAVFRKLILPVLMDGPAAGSPATDVRERVLLYRTGLVGRIRRSVETGELRADADPDRLVDLLMGTIVMPLLFFRDPPEIIEAEEIVDDVLEGYFPPDPAAPRTGAGSPGIPKG